MPQLSLNIVRFLVTTAAIVLITGFGLRQLAQKSINKTFQTALVPNEKKSLYFINSIPAHNEFFVTFPVNVVINFEKEITKSSSSITHNDKEVGKSPTIDGTRQTIRQNVEPLASNGIYKVVYSVCFPDGACSAGQFAYKINTAKITEFDNQTKRPNVTIKITDNSIDPQSVLVSPRTNISWVNEGEALSGIKTDPPDLANYYPSQNSEELDSGESFSLVFNTTGEYVYHLAVNSKVKGKIIVQSQ